MNVTGHGCLQTGSTMFGVNRLSLFILFGASVLASSHSIRKSPARVVIGETRNEAEFLEVNIKAAGKDYSLRMKHMENIWAKNARILTARVDEHGTTYLEDADLSDVPKDFRVYHDIATGAVLGVDGQKVNGIIGPSVTIKHEVDGHFVYLSDEPAERGFFNDYLIPPNVARLNPTKTGNNENGTIPPIIDIARQTPRPVTVDVLAVVDSVLAASLGTDSQIYAHLSTFWGTVNTIYGSITTPTTFTVRIVQAVFLRTDPTFVTQNLLTNGLGQNVLISFGSWVGQKYSTNMLPAHDFAYFQTGRDLISTDGSTGLLGLAWMSSACPSITSTMSYATGIGEDRLRSFDPNVAAHEMGHNLGAPHDGDASSGTGSCPTSGGYIMNPYLSTTEANRNKFSQCSANLMTSFSQTSQGACLFTNAAQSPCFGKK